MENINIIRRELIFTKESYTDRNEILNCLISRADELHLLNNKAEYLKDVLSREEAMSTAVGFNISIPHGRSRGVKTPFIAYMHTEKPFVWDENSSNQVDLIFLIGVPETNENNMHLRFLSEISKKLMDDDFRDALRRASSEDEVFSMLEDINQNVQKVN